MNTVHSAPAILRRLLTALIILSLCLSASGIALAAEEYDSYDDYYGEADGAYDEADDAYYAEEYDDYADYDDYDDYDDYGTYEEPAAAYDAEPATDGAHNYPPVYVAKDGTKHCHNPWGDGDYYGWLQWDGYWYYFDDYGQMLTGNCWVNGTFHCFDKETGEELHGWQGKRFFDYDSGAMLTGWLQWDGQVYYLDDQTGVRLTGWQYLWDDVYGNWGGDWFYFNDDGSLSRNCWRNFGSNKLYMDSETGRPVRGWLYVDNAWYHFDWEGIMETGWVFIDAYYYFDEKTGALYTGDSGSHSGWTQIGSDWYYVGSDGFYLTGWQYLNNRWVHFADSGKLSTGWTTLDGYDYYFYMDNDPNGGKRGAMAHDVTIDGVWIGSDGIAQSSNDPYNRMIRAAQEKSSPTNYLIMIDTDYCVLGVFEGSKGNWEMIYYWYCAPGAPSTPTVRGDFSIQAKGDYFFSGSAKCMYWCYFCDGGVDGGYCIHSTLRYADNSPMDSRVGMHLSHGCVRLEIDNAYWVWSNCPIGTTVISY